MGVIEKAVYGCDCNLCRRAATQIRREAVNETLWASMMVDECYAGSLSGYIMDNSPRTLP